MLSGFEFSTFFSVIVGSFVFGYLACLTLQAVFGIRIGNKKDVDNGRSL